MSESQEEAEFLGENSLEGLGQKEILLYIETWRKLLEFLRRKGKNPERNNGFAESNVRPIARRIHQVHEYFWSQGRNVLILTTDHAEEFVSALNKDTFLNQSGEPYSEGSKRKFTQALQAYFRFREIEWKPSIRFSEKSAANSGSDPFSKSEREKLLEAALNYQTPPSYSNVSPEERDSWNTYLSQLLGIPKEKIGPNHWESLQTNWKIPSLLSTALDAGWRAKLVGRLLVVHVNIDNGFIKIPGEIAVKNNRDWTNQLSRRSIRLTEKWLDQRSNISKYDNSDLVWLNRKGNPYRSATLNDLLSGLMDEAGIDSDGRKLTWHSVRHSTGMYVYDQTQDLGQVADVLRHVSLESARKYAHPTPETQKEVVESLQGGDRL